MEPVTVVRVGTQVVVRLAGDLDERQSDRFDAALAEIGAIVLSRVVVDCSAVGSVGPAGLDFIDRVGERWRMRLLDAPAGVRAALRRPS